MRVVKSTVRGWSVVGILGLAWGLSGCGAEKADHKAAAARRPAPGEVISADAYDGPVSAPAASPAASAPAPRSQHRKELKSQLSAGLDASARPPRRPN